MKKLIGFVTRRVGRSFCYLFAALGSILYPETIDREMLGSLRESLEGGPLQGKPLKSVVAVLGETYGTSTTSLRKASRVPALGASLRDRLVVDSYHFTPGGLRAFSEALLESQDTSGYS